MPYIGINKSQNWKSDENTTYDCTSEENLKPIKSQHKRIIKATILPFNDKKSEKKCIILNFENLRQRDFYDKTTI